jgi:hypothetical protein
METTEKKNLLSEKAMLVYLSASTWTGRKKDKKTTSEVCDVKKADSDAGSWITYLIPKKSIADIESAIVRCRQDHYRLSLPWIDGGLRILPSKLFMEYTSVMNKRIAEFEKTVDQFLVEYPNIIDNAKARLGDLSYNFILPTTQELKNRFSVRYDFMPLPETSDFRADITGSEVESLKNNIENSMKEKIHRMNQEVWDRLYFIVDKTVSVLSDDDKIIRKSLIEKLSDMANDHWNLTDDPKLSEIQTMIKDRLQSVKITDLRDDNFQRKNKSNELKEVLDKLNDFIG